MNLRDISNRLIDSSFQKKIVDKSKTTLLAYLSRRVLLPTAAGLLPTAAGLLVLTTLFACQDRASEPEAALANTSEQAELTQLDDIEALAQRISFGDKALILDEEIGGENANFRAAKARGIEAVAAGDYQTATSYFEEALSYYKNAPETLIYLNNARINDSTNRYTLAAAVPISDDLPAAQAMLRGVAQAQNKINENGGINGVLLRIVIADDAGDAATAPDLARTIASDSDVLGVVGHYYSSVTLSAENTYEQAQLAIIALSSSVEISSLDNDYIFRTSPSDAVTGKALADYALDNWNAERVAVFYNSDSSYSNSLKSEFENYILSEQGEVVAELDWSQKSFNPKRAFEQAVEQDAELLMVVPASFEELQKNVFPIAQQNFTTEDPIRMMGGDVAYSGTVLEEEFEGMVVGAFWHIGAVDPNAEFILQSRELWTADVNWVTAMAYDATEAWIEAFKRSEAAPTRTDLQMILSESTFSASGASSEVRFSRNGDRPIASQLVEVTRKDTSSEQYYFEPVSRD
ncbi:MAG: ABC transporter substrate-binding protein [Phormidesmis sp.]